MKRIVLIAAAWLLASGSLLAQEARPLSRGQTLYLPIYSHMLYGNVSSKGAVPRVLLSAMVSVRNTDVRRPIRLLSARYHDTGGKLLRDYLTAPVTIPPMGTYELFVELHDESGGSGANFMLAWDAAQAANPPMVEALHANLDSGKAVILTTNAVPVVIE
jgi:hypothetical protein